MDAAAWKRLEQLVDQALELEGEDRRSFLDGLGDPACRRDVEAFLAAEIAARGFLEEPVERRARALLESEAESFEDARPHEAAGVGPYRLRGELGEGGMGAVYLAERADGEFEQRVALKLVKRGMDTDEILARFRAERQILARLQHPHIARLLDGGASDAGQPYFAMEHVEGSPLTAYCDRARLTVGDRLRLFLQVCDAVEYAHRNLVVHRDLKPSNILVSADGVAKLLDFGIAKVLGASADGGATTVTRQEARPMTPQYAAPEQLLGEPVTTATDVYSLGVVLYELLSGRRPAKVVGLARAEVERVVRQRQREPPSEAVRREGEAPPAEEIAAARGLSPDRLARALRGDLDVVVGMALHPEPERRYPSVRALAEDLRRSLAGQPVAARPDTLSYRASKFVRRHRLAVAAAALVAASLMAGMVGTLWQAREAVRQARKAEEVKKFVFSIFEKADPNVGKGKELTARQLVEEGARRIPLELRDQPEVEAEMLVFVGTVHYRLGQVAQSRPLFERAAALRRERFGDDSAAVAEAEMWLGTVALWKGELDPARGLLDSAFRKRAKWLGEHHADTAYARGLLGRVHLEQGDIARAEDLLRSAVADERRALPAPHAELASNINFLGRVLQAKADYDGAERFFREGLEMRRQLFGEEHTRVAESQSNLATVMRDKGDPRGAEPWFRRALELDRRILPDAHDKVALDLHNLGSTLLVLGEYAEAEERLREAVDIRRRRYGPEGPMTALALHALARGLRYRGKLEEAESLSRTALQRAAAMLGDDHSNVAIVRQELAEILRARGRLDEAEALARRALATQRQKLPEGHPTIGDGLLVLSRVLLAARKAGEAEGSLQEALQVRRGRFGEGDWRTAEARLELAECLEALGRASEAAVHRTAARDVLSQRLGPQHPLARQAGAPEAGALSAVR